MYVCMYVCMYVGMYVYVYVCVWVFVCVPILFVVPLLNGQGSEFPGDAASKWVLIKNQCIQC